ncbi:sialate O-acetylesterase [Opitutales bacterium ASA1]|uniref:sialate O-acetylesterase n=1 Tax=Congregicoccus parvus TaxID=3081749 RepID=UPI002B3121C1|nr:sialate O-acetylesterase [Opitutales bacterium ASA1]
MLRRLAPWLSFIVASTFSLHAELRLGSPFGDHMVLQQEMPLPVWGRAVPGESITVRFGAHVVRTTADASGEWRATLPSLATSAQPRDFVVVAGPEDAPREHKVFRDVLVGEVWLCGGQSNMERQLGPRQGQKPIVGWAEAAAAATFPTVRQLYVSQSTANEPQAFVDATWSVCSPATAHDFTAVGFFFARALQQARPGVPIGLIHTSWGGTPAEAWTSRGSLAAFPEFTEAIDLARRAVADPEAARVEYLDRLEAWCLAHDPGTQEGWSDPDIDDTSWTELPVPGLWEDAGVSGWDGVAWYRRTFDLPTGWDRSDLVLDLAAVDDVDTTWINGIQLGTTAFYSTQRSYRIPAEVLRPTGNVVAVRVLDTGGGGGIWNEQRRLGITRADGESATIPLAGAWRVQFARELAGVPPPPEAPMVGGPNVPSVLHDGMIAPLVPYALRGALFYQGESNAGRPAQYRRLLPTMIADWRRTWGAGEFPFLFVQIAPYQGQPPEIREAQFLAWKETHNTAMIVTIDAGDAEDIHPAEKRPVGERLALAARALAYGESIAYSGPEYVSAEFGDGRATVRFNHTAGGMVAPGGVLTGFTIAGADGVFHPAEATIDGTCVVVSAPEVSAPVAVRYGWANVAEGTLFNDAGLPASPFRSDRPD